MVGVYSVVLHSAEFEMHYLFDFTYSYEFTSYQVCVSAYQSVFGRNCKMYDIAPQWGK